MDLAAASLAVRGRKQRSRSAATRSLVRETREENPSTRPDHGFSSSRRITDLGPEFFRPWSRRRRRRRGEREQTIVQTAPYFMITHVQTALRKAGNYDKTGRARKNTSALFVYTGRMGGGTRAKRRDARALLLLGHRLPDDLEFRPGNRFFLTLRVKNDCSATQRRFFICQKTQVTRN